MAQAWITLAGDDLWKVISRPVMKKADEDATGGTDALNNFNATLATRAKESVRMACTAIRMAIDNGQRTACSLTAGSIPPEAERHALFMAAYDLTSSPPSLQQVLIFEGGVYSPLQKRYGEAIEWLKSVQNGQTPVTVPIDPDPDTAPSAPRWGDAQGTSQAGTAGKIDMDTDGPWPETNPP
jgi:hypothetical protein